METSYSCFILTDFLFLTVNDIKAKWKNIRDSMLKSLQTKSGDCASKKKKYVHFEALTFLRTSAEKRR